MGPQVYCFLNVNAHVHVQGQPLCQAIKGANPLVEIRLFCQAGGKKFIWAVPEKWRDLRF